MLVKTYSNHADFMADCQPSHFSDGKGVDDDESLEVPDRHTGSPLQCNSIAGRPCRPDD